MRRMRLLKLVQLMSMPHVLHPVLSGPALDNIQKSAIEKLVVLDTIYLPEERLIDKIEQISIADLISEAIIRIHEKRPLSPLFEMGHK